MLNFQLCIDFVYKFARKNFAWKHSSSPLCWKLTHTGQHSVLVNVNCSFWEANILFCTDHPDYIPYRSPCVDPLVSFLSFRTDVRSKSTQNSQANICQWLPLPVSCLRIFCFDSLWPFCIQPASTAEHCFLEFFTIFGTRGNLHRLHLQEQTVELQSVSSAISSSL